MDADRREGANRVLRGLDEGAPAAAAGELAPLVYEDLRRLAAAQMAGEGPGVTLQPTALVHEVYLRLVDQSGVRWRGRTHFLAVGAQMMRRVLVDAARARGALKRGGGEGRGGRVTLSGVEGLAADGAGTDLGELEEALRELASVDERAARVVELRFYGGLTEEQIAEVLGVTDRTVRNDWRAARAWLRRAMSRDGGPGGEAREGT